MILHWMIFGIWGGRGCVEIGGGGQEGWIVCTKVRVVIPNQNLMESPAYRKS